MNDIADLDRDVDHLRDVQYRDSSNLARRGDLHAKYRTAPLSVFEWLGPLVPWREGDRVLDVGCGPGWLWEALAPSLPGGLRLTLSDLSPGMVTEAVARALGIGCFTSVDGQECDARSLPFGSSSFDVVVSTYALYHVPEPGDAVGEIARVLTDAGTAVVVTNGEGHLTELEELRVAMFGPSAAWSVNRAFAPRRAAGALIDAFDEVSWHRYRDELHCTDPRHVVEFVLSSPPGVPDDDEQRATMLRLVEQRMAAGGGVLRVRKDTGAFICAGPRSQ